MGKGDKKRRRALDAYDRLQRVATRSALRVEDTLQAHGLSTSQYGVLNALVSGGPTHQQELASALGRSKAQMTAIIDLLEERALVRRVRQSGDKRYITIHLTDAGTALHAAVTPSRDAAIVGVMSALSSQQRARLSRLCRRLLRAIDPPGEGTSHDDVTSLTAATVAAAELIAVIGNN